ncbi:MAG: hypothetical protein PF495_13415 [Spirochaetales bacterium]|nr:hypothetical protein [Spirochaetales bacterium]
MAISGQIRKGTFSRLPLAKDPVAELPKRELLEQKLHKAVELARKRLEAKPE